VAVPEMLAVVFGKVFNPGAYQLKLSYARSPLVDVAAPAASTPAPYQVLSEAN